MSRLISDDVIHLLHPEQVERLRGDTRIDPVASIVIPVNAEKDLDSSWRVLSDIGSYHGTHLLEIILVVNNFPADSHPDMIQLYQSSGLQVISIPKVEHVGGVAIAARIPGVRAAASEKIILFDADCRIPNATALIDWYIEKLEQGTQLAYTHVDYYDLPRGFSVKVRMWIHHGSRWLRRVFLRMPTSRGSNYAMPRWLLLELFDQGRLPYDFHVGPVVKTMGGLITYSGLRELMVYTSGRFFSGGWKELFDYLVWRVGYYRRVAPSILEATRFSERQ